MAFGLLLTGLILCIIWLGGLTWYFYTMRQNYRIFTKGSSKKTLDGVLNEVIKEIHHGKEDIAQLADRCATIEQKERFHIQKIGLLRFNPFKDTGGDQSFVLALVDAQNTGVIITALYSRSGTRWYAKNITEGKGAEHELSDEEKKALQIAQKVHH